MFFLPQINYNFKKFEGSNVWFVNLKEWKWVKESAYLLTPSYKSEENQTQLIPPSLCSGMEWSHLRYCNK